MTSTIRDTKHVMTPGASGSYRISQILKNNHYIIVFYTYNGKVQNQQ